MDELGHEATLDNYGIMADPEALILVDEADRSLGHLSKALCHKGRGVLHRAFSLLIFNDRGELLLQQRAANKRLWPLYWSNSCCSHPRRAESMEAATRRRLLEELGLSCDLQFLFKFRYQAQFDATGAENELCSVFIGRCDQPAPGQSGRDRGLALGQPRSPTSDICRRPTAPVSRRGLSSSGRECGTITAPRCLRCGAR